MKLFFYTLLISLLTANLSAITPEFATIFVDNKPSQNNVEPGFYFRTNVSPGVLSRSLIEDISIEDAKLATFYAQKERSEWSIPQSKVQSICEIQNRSDHPLHNQLAKTLKGHDQHLEGITYYDDIEKQLTWLRDSILLPHQLC